MYTNQELILKLEKLQEEYSNYQNFSETNIKYLSDEKEKLSKKLDAMSSIIEVSKYINSNVSHEDLIPMINDVIIGILGVNYSTIYFKEDSEDLLVRATNITSKTYNFYNKIFTGLENGEAFLINCKKPVFSDCLNIRSVVGVPIYIMDILRGYVIVEHSLYDFFGYEHISFISSIANQIGIAIENAILYKKIRETSIRDPLLGIYNRKHFFELVKSAAEADKHKKFAVVMIDVDDFKKVNDIYGHQYGDEVLIETCRVIRNNLEEKDIVGRYGGEEIILFIGEAANNSEVLKKIENIRTKIMTNIVRLGNISSSITVSLGVEFFSSSDNIIDVVGRSDKALYKAKNLGKNKVVCA